VQKFGKYKNKFVDILGEFWSFFTSKLSYLQYQTQKICKLQYIFTSASYNILPNLKQK